MAKLTGDQAVGLYSKFKVIRLDGSSLAGGKHEHCENFVLDLNHDKFALPALKAYIEACRAEYPHLAADLEKLLPAPSKACCERDSDKDGNCDRHPASQLPGVSLAPRARQPLPAATHMLTLNTPEDATDKEREAITEEAAERISQWAKDEGVELKIVRQLGMFGILSVVSTDEIVDRLKAANLTKDKKAG